MRGVRHQFCSDTAKVLVKYTAVIEAESLDTHIKRNIVLASRGSHSNPPLDSLSLNSRCQVAESGCVGASLVSHEPLIGIRQELGILLNQSSPYTQSLHLTTHNVINTSPDFKGHKRMILLPQVLFSTYQKYNITLQIIKNIFEAESFLDKNCRIKVDCWV